MRDLMVAFALACLALVGACREPEPPPGALVVLPTGVSTVPRDVPDAGWHVRDQQRAPPGPAPPRLVDLNPGHEIGGLRSVVEPGWDGRTRLAIDCLTAAPAEGAGLPPDGGNQLPIWTDLPDPRVPDGGAP